MRRQGGISKAQGAAGLFIAALGILVMLAAPPSLRGWMNADVASAARLITEQKVPSILGEAPVADEQRRFDAAPGAAGGFHSVDEVTVSGSMSRGALGMFLLGGFSLLLLLWAFLLRTRQAHKE